MPNGFKYAGKITCNPLYGLCERVCIDVKRIYDGCVFRDPSDTFTLTLTNFSPAGTTPPYTFVQVRSNGEPVTLSNLTVTAGTDERMRVTYVANIPVTVAFTDSAGVSGTATSVISLNRDILLKVPSDPFVPYAIEAAANVLGNIGTFISDNVVRVTCCVVLVTRVVVRDEILVPSYGECEYPQCREFSDSGICPGLSEVPSFGLNE
jgi:hypothetical protein